MEDRKRQKSFRTELSLESKFRKKIKFIIFYNNKQLIYEYLQDNIYYHCVIPFSYINSIFLDKNDNSVIVIKLNFQPYLFKNDKKVYNYINLNNPTKIVVNSVFSNHLNDNHFLKFENKVQKAKEFLVLLNNYQNFFNKHLNLIDEKIFKHLNFSNFFFQYSCKMLNPELKYGKDLKFQSTKRKLEDDSEDDQSKKKKVIMGSCYDDNYLKVIYFN